MYPEISGPLHQYCRRSIQTLRTQMGHPSSIMPCSLCATNPAKTIQISTNSCRPAILLGVPQVTKRTYLCLCHRGRQTCPTCSETGDSGRRPLEEGASGWRTARLSRWGSWEWRRRCGEPRRRRSACSWTSCHKSRRWRTPLWRTANKLESEQDEF